MTPLPPPLGPGGLVAWRLHQARFSAAWDDGEGAYRFGGRWNTPRTRAVYCALDPATAIIEVAVHTGFATLDTVPHVLTAAAIIDLTDVCVIDPGSVPNPNWLRPCAPSAGQQSFGDALLARHKFVLLPSAVSARSWNIVFVAARAAAAYALRHQEPFALDPRLHPPAR